jgi:hypothetical protein
LAKLNGMNLQSLLENRSKYCSSLVLLAKNLAIKVKFEELNKKGIITDKEF